MPLGAALALSIAVLTAGDAAAQASPAPRPAYVGVWAGERMNCAWPQRRLHQYGPDWLRHPALYEDSAGHVCTITRRRGRAPEWLFDIRCRSFGTSAPPSSFQGQQRVTLLDGGRWMRVATTVGPQRTELSTSEYLLCRR